MQISNPHLHRVVAVKRSWKRDKRRLQLDKTPTRPTISSENQSGKQLILRLCFVSFTRAGIPDLEGFFPYMKLSPVIEDDRVLLNVSLFVRGMDTVTDKTIPQLTPCFWEARVGFHVRIEDAITHKTLAEERLRWNGPRDHYLPKRDMKLIPKEKTTSLRMGRTYFFLYDVEDMRTKRKTNFEFMFR